MKISTGTIIRTVLLLAALANQVLTVCGKSPLPFDDEQITEIVSLVLTTGASVAAWWKNNSFTAAAIEADELMSVMKGKK